MAHGVGGGTAWQMLGFAVILGGLCGTMLATLAARQRDRLVAAREAMRG